MTDNSVISGKERQCGQLNAARISLWGSVALFLISAVVGIAVDSVTLILDASGSLVIFVSAFLMHIAIKKIHQPPDDIFNFGYEKYEPLTVAVQGGLIMAVCIVSVKFAIQDMVSAEDIKNYSIPVIAMFVSGLIGLFITVFMKQAAKCTNSAMLHTAGMHWFIDTSLSFGVCAGFIVGMILKARGYTELTPYVDPVMAIILAMFFVQAPIKTLMRNVLELLDMVPGKEIQAKVKKVVEEYKPKSFGVHRLRSRKAGEKIFVDICFIVKGELTVAEVEELAGNFEKDIRANLPHSDVVVYFKPARR